MAAGPLGELGVAPQHAGILTALAGIEPCSQQRLASELGISGAALIGSLDELQRRVLISRQRNPDDRREQLLRLTPEGDVMRSAARSILDTVHEELAANVGVQELDELNELLLKVAS
jgi:DNA-binding MarR family transcriptional regulator